VGKSCGLGQRRDLKRGSQSGADQEPKQDRRRQGADNALGWRKKRTSSRCQRVPAAKKKDFTTYVPGHP